MYKNFENKVQKLLPIRFGNGDFVHFVQFSVRGKIDTNTHTRTPYITKFLVFILLYIPLFIFSLVQIVQNVQFPYWHILKPNIFCTLFCTLFVQIKTNP